MTKSLFRLALGLSALLACASVAYAGSTPKVVVSLKPIHSLVAGVMGELGEPTLLVKGAASPHSTSLRPSDARALSEADLVIWVGADMETFLARPLRRLADKAEVLTLSTLPTITLLENRSGGAWETTHLAESADAHDGEDAGGYETGGHEADHQGHPQDSGRYNLHVWLDPDNAVAVVEATVVALSGVDPARAAAYAKNGAALVRRLAALDRAVRAELAPVKKAPFLVFHDAYPYLETHYGLNAVGALTVSPERTPGAQRVREIRAKIRTLGATCVFGEPQFSPSVLRTVVEGTDARLGVLDPLGAQYPAGPEAYFSLMRGLSESLRDCLALAS